MYQLLYVNVIALLVTWAGNVDIKADGYGAMPGGNTLN